MPSSLWGHGIITVKSKGYFYSKAIKLIKCNLAHVTLMINTLPSEDRRAENLVNFQLASSTMVVRLSDSIKYAKWFLLAVLGLHCCSQRARATLELWGMGFSEWWLLLCEAQALEGAGSVVVIQGLNCSVAHEIFPAQVLNSCPLHCQVDF